MAWSTQQLADLADVTVKAIRYYHQIGLLEMPERMSNGYKQYQVAHLVRLLQIKRMTDLGIPLSEIADMESADEDSNAAIRVVDQELAATIDRLTRIREELAVLLKHRAPPDVPASFATLGRDLSQTERSLLTVYSSVLSEDAMDGLLAAVRDEQPVDLEFTALDPDADDATIEDLATRLVPSLRQARERYPALNEPAGDAPHGRQRALATMGEAVVQLYNPAQLKVLKRLLELAPNPPAPER